MCTEEMHQVSKPERYFGQVVYNNNDISTRSSWRKKYVHIAIVGGRFWNESKRKDIQFRVVRVDILTCIHVEPINKPITRCTKQSEVIVYLYSTREAIF